MLAGADLGLDVGLAKGFAHAHDFAGGFHFGAEDGVHAGEFDEGENGFLDAEVGRGDFLRDALFGQALPGHAAGGDFGQLHAGGFADEGHGAAGAGVDFEHVDNVAQAAVFGVDDLVRTNRGIRSINLTTADFSNQSVLDDFEISAILRRQNNSDK